MPSRDLVRERIAAGILAGWQLQFFATRRVVAKPLTKMRHEFHFLELRHADVPYPFSGKFSLM